MKRLLCVFLFVSVCPWALADSALTIIVRVPSATLGIDVERPNISADCNRQRNLDVQGIEQSRKLTDILAPLVQQHTPIYHSEYCRSEQTAKLIFPEHTHLAVSALNDACFNSLLQNSQHHDQIRARIANAEQTQVLISHNCNARMMFSDELAAQCDGLRRLEPGQWMTVKAGSSGIIIRRCPQ